MLAGKLPFEGKRLEAVLYAIGNEEPEPLIASPGATIRRPLPGADAGGTRRWEDPFADTTRGKEFSLLG